MFLQYRKLVKHVFNNVSAIMIHATLQKAIVLEWRELSQRFIDKSVDEWKRPLKCVVDQNSGHTVINSAAAPFQHL